jgi:hypothetical protein
MKTDIEPQEATASPSQAPNVVKFDKSFTQLIDNYILNCQQRNVAPSINAFAETIGTTQESIWGWATKNKKDEQGNTIHELARPNFFAAVKRLEKAEKEQQPKGLNEKQELFCQLYATDREFFGNGVQAYIEAYEPDTSKPNWYNGARASASRLLSDVNIYTRINELLEDGGLNDVNVDKQLQFLINQQDDKSTKLQAIREYNKLKQRIIDRIDHTSKGDKIVPILGGSAGVPSNNGNA